MTKGVIQSARIDRATSRVPQQFVVALSAAATLVFAGGDARADTFAVCLEAQARGEVLDETCVRVLQRYEDSASIGLSLGNSRYTLGPRSFLAREDLGTNLLELGIASPSREVQTRTYQLDFSTNGFTPGGLSYSSSVPLGGEVVYVFGTLMWSEGGADTFFPTIDPGVNHGLGIPGIDGGASGLFLPANPQNIVVDALHTVDLSWGQADLNIGMVPDGNDSTPEFHFGLRYSDLRQSESFGGEIPGYGQGAGFQYGFQADTRALGVHAGVSGSIPLPSDEAWDVALRYAGEFGVARVAGDGFASLDNFGALNVVAPSANTFSESDVRPYASLQVALEARFNNRFSAHVGVRYDLRPWGAGFSGDGTNPFTMEIQDMNVVTAFVGARLRF